MSNTNPVHPEKLQVQPDEINEQTGRIRIQRPESTVTSGNITQMIIAPTQSEPEPELLIEASPPRQSVWGPRTFFVLGIASLLAVILAIILTQFYQRIDRLEQRISDLTASERQVEQTLNKVNLELALSRQGTATDVDALKKSITNLKSDYAAIKKGIESFNAQQVEEPNPAVTSAAPTPLPSTSSGSKPVSSGIPAPTATPPSSTAPATK